MKNQIFVANVLPISIPIPIIPTSKPNPLAQSNCVP